jgi:BNR/Asp-box repeat protein
VSTIRFNDKNWLAVDPATNELYLVWTIFVATPTSTWGPTSDLVPDPLGKGEIFFSKSSDGGATWTAEKKISEGLANQGAVPAVASDGTLYVVWNGDDPDEVKSADKPAEGHMVFVKSTDHGETFTTPLPIGAYHALPPTLANSFFRVGSLPGFAIDRSSGPNKGALYSVYASWNPAEENSDVLLVASHDGGKTWTAPIQVNDDATKTDQWMPNLAVDAAGTIHVTWLDRRDDPTNTKYYAYAATSNDGGKTFRNARASDVASDPLAGQDDDPMTGVHRTINFIGDYIQVATWGTKAYSLYPDLRESGDAKRLVNVNFAAVEAAATPPA